MICRYVQWRNFRNLKPQRLEWAKGLHLLVGENAAGKTNSLEALHILTGWGPFGNSRVNDLATWAGPEECFLGACFEGEETVEVGVGISGRTRMKMDGRTCRATDMRMRVPSLSFLPEDMSLIEGSPSVRRRFLDRICALLFPLYAPRLHEYRRAVRQRTAAIRSGRGVSVASRAMAPLASWIWNSRAAAVDLVKLGMEACSVLVPGKVGIHLVRGGSSGIEDGMEDFWKGLHRLREKEDKIGVCLVGPHRDDLIISSGERQAAETFSRGHRRRAAVALLIAAGWAVERKTRRKPLLLLDEVMAELDTGGREKMIEALVEREWQTFVTTAEDCTPVWPGSVWRVKNGHLMPDGE
ncbi:MAG: DNA replication/repair protein RecF [Thermovirgaceae bacterium]